MSKTNNISSLKEMVGKSFEIRKQQKAAMDILEVLYVERGHLRVRYAETCWTDEDLKNKLEFTDYLISCYEKQAGKKK